MMHADIKITAAGRTLVRCQTCGEFVDESTIKVCKGCGLKTCWYCADELWDPVWGSAFCPSCILGYTAGALSARGRR